jgi:hypothetical protein
MSKVHFGREEGRVLCGPRRSPNMAVTTTVEEVTCGKCLRREMNVTLTTASVPECFLQCLDEQVAQEEREAVRHELWLRARDGDEDAEREYYGDLLDA